MLEAIRPEIMQYFVETDTEGRPFDRIDRSLVYRRAKNATDTTPFGTQEDTYKAGYEWINHSLYAKSHHDVDIDDRFADFLNRLGLGKKGRVIDDQFGAIGERDLINDRRVGRDHIHVELAAQAFLDDLHVKHSQETTTETKS